MVEKTLWLYDSLNNLTDKLLLHELRSASEQFGTHLQDVPSSYEGVELQALGAYAQDEAFYSSMGGGDEDGGGVEGDVGGWDPWVWALRGCYCQSGNNEGGNSSCISNYSTPILNQCVPQAH